MVPELATSRIPLAALTAVFVVVIATMPLAFAATSGGWVPSPEPAGRGKQAE